MTDKTFNLPSLSPQPSRAEIAALLGAIKHDWIGLMQAFKIGLELLKREELDSGSIQEVLALIQENVERGLAYGQLLERLARQLESE
ncbi:MAG: hypothetical protein SNJ58_00140 [Aggregatilineales bacterium]